MSPINDLPQIYHLPHPLLYQNPAPPHGAAAADNKKTRPASSGYGLERSKQFPETILFLAEQRVVVYHAFRESVWKIVPIWVIDGTIRRSYNLYRYSILIDRLQFGRDPEHPKEIPLWL